MNDLPKLGQDNTPAVPKQLGKRPDGRATNASQPKSEPKEATKQTEAKDPNMEDEATNADRWTEVNRNLYHIGSHTIGPSANDLNIYHYCCFFHFLFPFLATTQSVSTPPVL